LEGHEIKTILWYHIVIMNFKNPCSTHKIQFVFVWSGFESRVILGNHKPLKKIHTSLPNLILELRDQIFPNSSMNTTILDAKTNPIKKKIHR
jgi:hypothetical protein